MAGIFHNKNGLDYEILQVLDFNERDCIYYKDSWQKHRAGLLKRMGKDSFVVANMLGESEWGDGYYTEDKRQAETKYKQIVSNYSM